MISRAPSERLGPTSVGVPGQATNTPAMLSTAQAARIAALNLKYRSALRKSSQVSRRMATTLRAVLSALGADPRLERKAVLVELDRLAPGRAHRAPREQRGLVGRQVPSWWSHAAGVSLHETNPRPALSVRGPGCCSRSSAVSNHGLMAEGSLRAVKEVYIVATEEAEPLGPEAIGEAFETDEVTVELDEAPGSFRLRSAEAEIAVRFEALESPLAGRPSCSPAANLPTPDSGGRAVSIGSGTTSPHRQPAHGGRLRGPVVRPGAPRAAGRRAGRRERLQGPRGGGHPGDYRARLRHPRPRHPASGPGRAR